MSFSLFKNIPLFENMVDKRLNFHFKVRLFITLAGKPGILSFSFPDLENALNLLKKW